jgi:uncharacterized protein YbaA (DUF1428 family)
MSYVDGFVIVVPKKNLKAYVKMARVGQKVWKKHGALDYRECWGDDLDPGFGAGFKKMLKVKPSETVVFAYIVYRSRAHRDQVNKKVMSDPSMSEGPQEMPFDMRRMAYGGFRTLVGG